MFLDGMDTVYINIKYFWSFYQFDLGGYNKSFLFWKALIRTLCGINLIGSTANGPHTEEGLRVTQVLVN